MVPCQVLREGVDPSATSGALEEVGYLAFKRSRAAGPAKKKLELEIPMGTLRRLN